jgi:hypothetical protein
MISARSTHQMCRYVRTALQRASGLSQYTIGDVGAYRARDTAASERSRIISVIPGRHGARCNDQQCDDLAPGALADAQVGIAGFLDPDAGVAQRLDGQS